jgi:hypothetical protein
MPVAKFTCPECEAVLRPAKPLPSGKKVTCPKCKATFVVHDAEEEAGKKSGAAAGAKNDPFDEEGPETYAVVKEEEPEEEPDEDEEEDDEDEDGPKKSKPKKERARSEDLEFRLNVKVTDPRGPAQAALVSPSNYLILVGSLMVIGGIIAILVGAWPFLFSKDIIDPAKVLNAPKKSDDDDSKESKNKRPTTQSVPMMTSGDEVDEEKLSQEQKQKLWDARDERWWELFWFMLGGSLAIAYNAVVIVAGVKMQNMESYTWSMVGAIMALGASFPALGQLAGFIALTTLRSKKVIDGFFYVPPSATPHKKQKKQVL